MSYSIAEKRELFEKRRRSLKRARGYIERSVNWLHGWRDGDPLPHDPEYWDLLNDLIRAARDIAKALPDEFFEERTSTPLFGLGGGTYNMSDESSEYIEKLVAVFEKRRSKTIRTRLIEKLENVEGRTPEEAAVFLTKAAELRESGL